MRDYDYRIETKLKAALNQAHKNDKKLYEAVLKKIEEILDNPHRYKPLRYDLKGLKRVHMKKSFVLVFEIDDDQKVVRFLDLDHHDTIYKKR